MLPLLHLLGVYRALTDVNAKHAVLRETQQDISSKYVTTRVDFVHYYVTTRVNYVHYYVTTRVNYIHYCHYKNILYTISLSMVVLNSRDQ